jgi:tRNA (cytidine32/uridine32-2'-O)-methyltransferase
MRFVLARPQHPGNIGAAARAIKVMGWSDFRVVDPKKKAFPSTEASNRAAGAGDVLNGHPVVSTLDEAIADCEWVVGLSARKRNEGPQMLDIRDVVVSALAKTGPVAFVFGNERAGLSNDELTRCHCLVHIPTGPELSSLNLGAAVQVVAYELHRARLIASDDQPVDGDAEKPASRGEIDFVVQRLWDLRESLEQATGTATVVPSCFHAFRDVQENVRLQLQKIRSHPWIPASLQVRGFVYDVKTGHLSEVGTPSANR